MAVDIAAKYQFPLSFGLLDKLFGEVYGGMRGFAGCDPLPVEIGSWQITPVVAYDHPVDIQHGYYLEDEILSQISGNGTIPQQKLYDVLYDVAGHCLAGMDAGGQHNSSFVFSTLANYEIVESSSQKRYVLPDYERHKNFFWNRVRLTGSLSSPLMNLSNLV